MPFIEEADASPEVKAVYDDIKATRKVDWINNFWKVLANDPATLKRTWEDLKQVMAPGTALDPVVKEMLYLAVSMTNSCEYCIVSHTAAARKAGMNDAMLAELVSIVGMANATNRMVNAYRTEPDPKLVEAAKGGKKP
jgi:AhpD family alkylhydroperoxidase